MDERFVKEDGLEVYTGNELLLKGALESGVALITGYPGSPISELFDAAQANADLLKTHGILAEIANNEALAVARLNGSRMAGVRALAAMKSVGLHVAADGLALGNLAEPRNAGGGVVVVGDDPWIESTQINNDSRFLSQHLHMPVLEPSTFQEMKDWVGAAFDLSSASDLYLTYLITTPQADGGGTVWVHPNRYPTVNTHAPVTLDTSTIALDTNVLLPPRTWSREATLEERFERLLMQVRAKKLNRIIDVSPAEAGDQSRHILDAGLRRQDNPHDRVGFAASGMAYCYLEHALTEMGLSGQFPILKLGLTYPVDPAIVLQFADDVDQIVVIEEKRGFVEQQIVKILHDQRQATGQTQPSVWGKKFPESRDGIPEHRGLNTSLLIERLNVLLGRAVDVTAKSAWTPLPIRTPTFCPGCPHRDSSSVFLQIKKDFKDPVYMAKTHRREPTDLVFHGETGCFTMLMFEPNKELMHNYSGMGLGGGTGAGLDPFVTNKQVVFLGDSTFFHSGMLAISDSIKSHQDITYVILDNKTTAMTGHQPTPGTELDLMGEKTFAQDIEKALKGMTAGSPIPVTRTNPDVRDAYRELLEDTILQDGVKVIIADKECGLTAHRRVVREQKAVKRRTGYLPLERHINITPEACEFCLECTKTTGCPGLTIENTLYGPKIVTDLSSCVSDGACAKVKACPAFEEIEIERRAASQAVPTLPSFVGLPEPHIATFDSLWYAATAGVGGMGSGMLTSVLVLAAHREGYRTLFLDKKGLAVRNGGVYGHVLLSKEGGVLSPNVPYGKAHLVLGLDLVETVRSFDPVGAQRVAHPERTAAVVNTAFSPTVRMLVGADAYDADGLMNRLRASVRPDALTTCDVSAISQHFWGSTVYANSVLLGLALQKGHLPLRRDTVEWALARRVPKEDRQANLEAFHVGRVLAEWPQSVHVPQTLVTYKTLLEEKERYLCEGKGKDIARRYRALVEQAVFDLDLGEDVHIALALRVYDLIQYEGLDTAERYLALVQQTASRDRESWGYEATRAVIANVFKVMAIKDEIYVAHLLTSPEKIARDRVRYRIDPANGDRVRTRHFNRPEFVLAGRRFRWSMTTRSWQLRLMRRMTFLRRWLTGWHALEKEYRDWYLDVVGRFQAKDRTAYALWLDVLRAPEYVRGYREIREPRMRQSRKEAEDMMKKMNVIASERSERGNLDLRSPRSPGATSR